jgi:hypothetical protein
MTRNDVLHRLDNAWSAFRDSYAGLSQAELMEPGVTGAWSVRDILAHVTTWEEEALKYLPVIHSGGKTPRYSVAYGGINAFNAQSTERKRDLSLSEVLRKLDEAHERIIDLIAGTPEDQLGSDSRFLRRLRSDTYGHYPKHTKAIREWRERRSGAR